VGSNKNLREKEPTRGLNSKHIESSSSINERKFKGVVLLQIMPVFDRFKWLG